MKRAEIITYQNFKYTNTGVIFNYFLDGLPLSFYSNLNHDTITLPRNQKDWVASNVGMTYLIDLCQISLPKKVVVNLPQITRKDLVFWKEQHEGFSIQRVYEDKLPIEYLDSSWEVAVTSELTSKSLEIINIKKNGLLLGISGGKESLCMLSMFKDEKPTVFYYQYENDSPSIINVYDTLRFKYPAIKISSNISDTEGFLDRYSCNNYSLFVTPQIVFNTLFYADQFKYLALGNEYSAVFGNAMYFGKPVNHQVDKAYPFAEKINSYIQAHLLGAFTYFSPFFGYYELQITKRFLSNCDNFDIWTSCNNSNSEHNFCCDCSKCAFIYAISLPFTTKERLTRHFWQKMFDGVELFKPLMDLDADKPIECVGEKEEVWTALYRIYKQGRELQTPVMRHFVKSILPYVRPQIKEFSKVASLDQLHSKYIPPEYRSLVRHFMES